MSEPLVAVEPGKLKKIRGRDVGIRFAFGAAVSILAGLVSIVFNPVVGGMFLAFPAILPASVTLIEEKESTGKAATDIEGATIGALGLAVFAVVTGTVLRHTTAVLALFAATGAWLATSVVLYLVIETLLRRRAHGPRPAGRRLEQSGEWWRPAAEHGSPRTGTGGGSSCGSSPPRRWWSRPSISRSGSGSPPPSSASSSRN
jgi:hypothetical protein